MPREMLAREIMSRPVRQLTVATPVKDAAGFLLRHGISGAPVIDDHGRWVGVFTQTDIARYVQSRIAPRHPERTLESREAVTDLSVLSAEKLGEMPVRDFMTAGLFTVFPEATLDEVAGTMSTFKVHRVFVIEGRTGNLLGVITTMDVLRWMGLQRAGVPKSRKTQQA